MSSSFTNQTLAQIELWTNRTSGKYSTEGSYSPANIVYKLPKELDEKVARLHLKALGAELSTLSQEQADYIGVHPTGPFKKDTYKY